MLASQVNPSRSAPGLLPRLFLIFLRPFYRMRSSGADALPTNSGALLLANHLSAIDVLILQAACPRPLYYIDRAIVASNWRFRLLFRLAGAKAATEADAVTRLKNGALILIFPEGAISRTGQLMRLETDWRAIALAAAVPVVPVFLDGLWGSVFSFSSSRFFWKSPRLMPTPVFVAWGNPISPERATPGHIREQLLDLGCEAFAERPLLKRHLAREAVRGLARHPWKTVLIDRTAERRAFRAAKVLAVSIAISRHLRKTVREPRIGIVLPPGIGAVLANLATLCAGRIPVNLNFTAGRAAIEASLRMAGIRTVITADALRAKAPQFPWPDDTRDIRALIQAAGGTRAVLPWLLAAYLLPNQWIAPLLGLPKSGDKAEAALLFTSGSAGEPKGVVLSHRNILANCAQIASLSILPPESTLLGCLPIFHSFGFTVTLWYPILQGCGVVTVPSPLDTRRIVDAIRDERITVMVGAPTFMRPLLKRADAAELRSLRILVSGAEKLPDELYNAFQKQLGLTIHQGYGLTETSPATNVNQPDPTACKRRLPHQSGQRAGTVGRMMPGMSARIFHPETGETVTATETGIVAFRGDNIFPGYLDDSEKTAAAFRDGWFLTGDLGHFDEDGFLVIEGRLSRFSKIGGEMVPHGTIEQRLLEALGVADAEGYVAVVTAVPDPGKGEQLVLLTTLDLTPLQVRDALAGAGLPNLWIPRDVRRVATIPTLGTGKLDLKGIRDLAAQVS